MGYFTKTVIWLSLLKIEIKPACFINGDVINLLTSSATISFLS